MVDFTVSGEIQSIMRILGDIKAQNFEICDRMERLEAEMDPSKAAASSIETKGGFDRGKGARDELQGGFD